MTQTKRPPANPARFTLLHRCPLVEPGKASSPYAETHEERRERRALEWAFGGAFHDFAKQYSFIAVPNYANGLNEYRLEIGYELFEKYGWSAAPARASIPRAQRGRA